MEGNEYESEIRGCGVDAVPGEDGGEGDSGLAEYQGDCVL